jgi:hypothetical protein
VFDAAVRAGWTYLGGLADEPMFAPEDFEQLVTADAPPNVLLLATDPTGSVIAYAAAHPEDGEMLPATGPTAQSASRTSAEPRCASSDSSSSCSLPASERLWAS